MTRKQKIASFQISYAMAMVDNLKKQEKPKGFLWNKLNSLEDHLGRVLDFYRIEKLSPDDLDKASALFDTLDGMIRGMY